jgi:hypothetical protein
MPPTKPTAPAVHVWLRVRATRPNRARHIGQGPKKHDRPVQKIAQQAGSKSGLTTHWLADGMRARRLLLSSSKRRAWRREPEAVVKRPVSWHAARRQKRGSATASDWSAPLPACAGWEIGDCSTSPPTFACCPRPPLRVPFVGGECVVSIYSFDPGRHARQQTTRSSWDKARPGATRGRRVAQQKGSEEWQFMFSIRTHFGTQWERCRAWVWATVPDSRSAARLTNNQESWPSWRKIRKDEG